MVLGSKFWERATAKKVYVFIHIYTVLFQERHRIHQ